MSANYTTSTSYTGVHQMNREKEEQRQGLDDLICGDNTKVTNGNESEVVITTKLCPRI